MAADPSPLVVTDVHAEKLPLSKPSSNRLVTIGVAVGVSGVKVDVGVVVGPIGVAVAVGGTFVAVAVAGTDVAVAVGGTEVGVDVGEKPGPTTTISSASRVYNWVVVSLPSWTFKSPAAPIFAVLVFSTWALLMETWIVLEPEPAATTRISTLAQV